MDRILTIFGATGVMLILMIFIYIQMTALQQQKMARESLYCLAGEMAELKELQQEDISLMKRLYERN